MTRFLSNFETSSAVGYVFQSAMILSWVGIYSVFTIWINRFWHLRKEHYLKHERIMIIACVIQMICEFIRCIDPFSMNGILSFRVNRIIFLIQGSIFGFPMVSYAFYALLVLFFQFNKQELPKYNVYLMVIPSTLTAISTLPVIVGVIMNTTVADTLYLIHLLLKIGASLTGAINGYILYKTMSTPLALQEDNENPNNASMVTMEHANQKLTKGTTDGIKQLVISTIYMWMDVIDGCHVISGKYFWFGLIFGLSSRFMVMTSMRMTWILPMKYDATKQMIRTRNKKIDLRNVNQVNDDNASNPPQLAPQLAVQTTVGYLNEMTNPKT